MILDFGKLDFLLLDSSFSLYISQDTVNYLMAISELEENDFQQTLTLHHLGLQIYKNIITVQDKIALTAVKMVKGISENYMQNIRLFLPEINMDINVVIAGDKNFVDDLIKQLELKKLNLPKINHAIKNTISKTFIRNKLYTFTLSDEQQIINSRDYSYIGLTVRGEAGALEKVYLSKHIIQHVLALYNGFNLLMDENNAIIMSCSITILNLWLSTLSKNIVVTNYHSYPPLHGVYNKILISGNGITGDLLFVGESSLLLQLFNLLEVVDTPVNKSRINHGHKITWPVFVGEFGMNKEQINTLKVDSTVFDLLKNINHDQLTIEIGSVKLIAEHRDNKLYIIDKIGD